MATVDGITVAKAEEIEGKTIQSAAITGGQLVLTLVDGTTINAGPALSPSDLAAHAGDQTAIHGVGVLVGTTETQTLSGKTLTTPTIGSFVNAQHDHGSAAEGGVINSFSGVQATRTAVQGVSTGNNELLSFTGSTIFDTDSYKTSNTVFTIPEDGMYDILVQVPWAANSTGRRSVDIRLNDSSSDGSNGTSVGKENPSPGHAASFHMSVSSVGFFETGDTIKVLLFQNSGGGLDVMGDTAGTRTAITISKRLGSY